MDLFKNVYELATNKKYIEKLYDYEYKMSKEKSSSVFSIDPLSKDPKK